MLKFNLNSWQIKKEVVLLNLVKVIVKEVITIKKRLVIEIVLIILSGLCLYFVTTHNESWYRQDIGRIVSLKDGRRQMVKDEYNNRDYQTKQNLEIKLLNGKYQGKKIKLTNTYSASRAFDQKLHLGQEIFVNLHHENGQLVATFAYSKRDTLLLMLIWTILVLLYLTMRFKGLRTVTSVKANFIIFLLFVKLDVNLNLTYFFWLFAASALIFTALSLILIMGFNRQCLVTFSSIVIGTSLGLAIGYLALWLTDNRGVHYEALDMATQSPEQLFFAATLIGLLGAVMDAATDIVVTLFELKESKPDISRRQLFLSGRQVGRAILGPLINVLFLIFFAETFAMAVLYLRTGNTFAYTFNWTMSLGVVQSLISGIGISLVIPTASLLSAYVLGGKTDVSA